MTDPLVQELLDRVAIQELVARYNRAADDRQIDDFVATFTPDAVFEVAGVHRAEGHDAIRKMIGRATWGSVHLTTDPIVEVDGDHATHRCTMVLARRTEDRQAHAFVATGRYTDQLAREGGQWRFRHRYVEPDVDTTVIDRMFVEPLG